MSMVGAIVEVSEVKSLKSVKMMDTFSCFRASVLPFSFNSSAISLGKIFRMSSSDLFFSRRIISSAFFFSVISRMIPL